jgi:hypothetical protein
MDACRAAEQSRDKDKAGLPSAASFVAACRAAAPMLCLAGVLLAVRLRLSDRLSGTGCTIKVASST